MSSPLHRVQWLCPAWLGHPAAPWLLNMSRRPVVFCTLQNMSSFPFKLGHSTESVQPVKAGAFYYLEYVQFHLGMGHSIGYG